MTDAVPEEKGQEVAVRRAEQRSVSMENGQWEELHTIARRLLAGESEKFSLTTTERYALLNFLEAVYQPRSRRGSPDTQGQGEVRVG